MSRIGIVTITGDTNYGNRLQNFALQEVLTTLGADQVESIEGLPRAETSALKAQRLVATAFARRQEYLDRLLRNHRGPSSVKDSYSCPPERRRAIRQFVEQYIHTAPVQYRRGANNSDLLNRYDKFVVGSDQVWNPAFTHGNPEWFLDFAAPPQRIAYAASFGVPRVPQYLAGRFREGLARFGALSVREHQAADIVERLIGHRPPVVLDPTMLLRREVWAGLAQRPAGLEPDSYVAKFMLSSGDSLGGGTADLKAVEEHARRHQLRIVDLHDPVEDELAALGPLGFVGAIEGAALVVTDSFHAAVFSILFHRPFLLVQRGAMNSRFETLLAHTGLRDRLLSEANDIDHSTQVDWELVDVRLETTRRESVRFLQQELRLHQPFSALRIQEPD